MEQKTATKQAKRPSPRQKLAANAVVENLQSSKPEPLNKVLESVGYGFGLQNSPSRVLESQGFKSALNELGLTEELITSSLVSDIENKPKNRLGELKLGAELLGMVKREDDTPKGTNNTYNFLFSSETQAEIAAIEEKIKARLIQKYVQEDT